MVLVAVVTVVMTLLRVPAAPLFGGLVAGVVHALTARVQPSVPAWTFRAGQGVVGASVGAAIDWGALVDLGSAWPAVLLVVVLTLVVSVGLGQLLRLHRGMDAATATFASVAGGASGMAAMARDAGADERIVAVVQYLRVLVILATLPFAVAFALGSGSGGATPDVAAGWRGLVLAALAIVLGTVGGQLLHLPSPAVLGSLVAASLLALVPWFEGEQVPAAVQAGGFLLIGAQVGLRFTPETLRRLGRMMPTALVVIVLVIAACAGLGLLLSALTGVPRADAYLATTPGGLPAVLAATSATGADLSFVSAVQILRLLIVLLLVPVVASLLSRGPRRRGSGPDDAAD